MLPILRPSWLDLAGAIAVGILMAAQARVNGELGAQLSDGFVAAAISFGSGLVILVAISAALPAGRVGLRSLLNRLRKRTLPWWLLAGGAAGAFTVASQGLTVGIIGLSLFSVGVIAGQAAFGLALDRLGYGPSGRVPVTVPRVLGGALSLGAVAIGLIGGSAHQAPIWMILLPVAVGAGIAWQQGTNGRLRDAIGSPITATLVNFAGGTVLLVVAAAAHVAWTGAPHSFPAEPWLYLGGLFGVVYIFLAASIVPRMGVLLFGLATVTGQLATSFSLDLFWPAHSGMGVAQALLTVSMALVAVTVATAPWARRPRHASLPRHVLEIRDQAGTRLPHNSAGEAPA